MFGEPCCVVPTFQKLLTICRMNACRPLIKVFLSVLIIYWTAIEGFCPNGLRVLNEINASRLFKDNDVLVSLCDDVVTGYDPVVDHLTVGYQSPFLTASTWACKWSYGAEVSNRFSSKWGKTISLEPHVFCLYRRASGSLAESLIL